MRRVAVAVAALSLVCATVTADVGAEDVPPQAPDSVDTTTEATTEQKQPDTDVLGSETMAVTTTIDTIAVTGAVRCAQGKRVVGVWVKSSTGGSGFAGGGTPDTSFKSLPANPVSGTDRTIGYYKKTLRDIQLPSDISVHVGCGGSPSDWDSDNYSPVKTVVARGHTNYLSLNATGCAPPYWVEGQTVIGDCGRPKTGDLAAAGAANPVGAIGDGYCTCGAAREFMLNVGRYPGWQDDVGRIGNAYEWADLAKGDGWDVSSDPWPHSVIVFESRNHVGWVTKIDWSKLTLTYIDMNGGKRRSGTDKTTLFALYDTKTCNLKTLICTSKYYGTTWNSLSDAERFILAPNGFEYSFSKPSVGECAV